MPDLGVAVEVGADPVADEVGADAEAAVAGQAAARDKTGKVSARACPRPRLSAGQGWAQGPAEQGGQAGGSGLAIVRLQLAPLGALSAPIQGWHGLHTLPDGHKTP